MRVVVGSAIALAVVISVGGCGGTEDVVDFESPTVTTLTASAVTTPSPTQTPEPSSAVPSAATTSPGPSTTTQGMELVEYSDSDYDVALQYPRGWVVSIVPVTPDQAELDVLKKVEFIAKDSLPRIRLFIGANPDGFSLFEWLENRNPIFLDTPPQEVTVSGVSGLFQPLSLGLPMPQVFVSSGPIIVSIAALTDEDYQTVIGSLVIS